MARLGGQHVAAHAEKVILLASVDERGWPHVAMLSYFEVIARDSRTLYLAIGGRSTSARNLRAREKLTLIVVDVGLASYIKGRAQEVKPHMEVSPEDAIFRIAVEDVLLDQAREGESPAAIASPVTYRCADPDFWKRRGEAIFRELTSWTL
jgi:flavin reductase (DIM6/NTAB) family NADH-FMN oxidoreductase RutF